MIAIAIFHGRKFSENVLKKNGSTLIMENQTRIQRFEIEFDEFWCQKFWKKTFTRKKQFHWKIPITITANIK